SVRRGPFGLASVGLAQQLDARADHVKPVVEAHADCVTVRAAQDENVAVAAQVAVHEDWDALPVAQGGNGPHLAVGEVADQLLLVRQPNLAGTKQLFDPAEQDAPAGRQDKLVGLAVDHYADDLRDAVAADVLFL